MVFFFQAEDGIRDSSVTGVQTCALPISPVRDRSRSRGALGDWKARVSSELLRGVLVLLRLASDEYSLGKKPQTTVSFLLPDQARRASDPPSRSEERRVGKEGRPRWSPYH